MASITTWSRLVPITRSFDVARALSAEIRDPLWLLAVQRRIGELRGEDTGSPAFVRIAHKKTPLTDLVFRSGTGSDTTVALDPNKPFEAQILAEPHAADLAMQVELSVTFMRMLDEAFGGTAPSTIKDRYRTATGFGLASAATSQFDPIDAATAAFNLVASGRALNGVVAYQKAKLGEIPNEVQQVLGPGDDAKIQAAYSAFAPWVEAVYGEIGSVDPKGWNPKRLEYDVRARFGSGSTTTLVVRPNETGSVDWKSFDVESSTTDPFPSSLVPEVARDVPTDLRFPGMPAPRFWDFESGDLPLPDVDVARNQLLQLLVIDFAMIYGVDWFVTPLTMEVGHAVKIDSLVVYDVFGGRTVVDRVEEQVPPVKFSMFGVTAPAGTSGSFMVLPPAAGRALQHGPSMEEVRFVRDEVANMAWGIEAITASRIGEQRRGNERDSAVDAAAPPLPEPPATDAPLRYQVESRVPAQWIPFLVPNGAPSTELEKGATLRRNELGNPVPVPALGKILNPTGLLSYRINEEEVPKSGAKVERLLYLSRSRDGKSYLWTARRKRIGSEETQSGLRFDAVLPTVK
jgi:hypothetical protein